MSAEGNKRENKNEAKSQTQYIFNHAVGHCHDCSTLCAIF